MTTRVSARTATGASDFCRSSVCMTTASWAPCAASRWRTLEVWSAWAWSGKPLASACVTSAVTKPVTRQTDRLMGMMLLPERGPRQECEKERIQRLSASRSAPLDKNGTYRLGNKRKETQLDAVS
jgi:hypothetical protein